MSEKPKWNLVAKAKSAPPGVKGEKIGAAWENEKGWIRIVLDNGVRVLSSDTHWLSLYPNVERGGREFGAWPKGDPRNCRAGESMAEFHRRRRREALTERQTSPSSSPPTTPPPDDVMPPRGEDDAPSWL